MGVDWPSPAACAMRLITRGLRHAAHIGRLRLGKGCIPMTLQEGVVAVYWPPPAAGAMRLTTRGWRHAAHGQGDFCLPCNNVRSILLPQRSISSPSFFDTG